MRQLFVSLILIILFLIVFIDIPFYEKQTSKLTSISPATKINEPYLSTSHQSSKLFIKDINRSKDGSFVVNIDTSSVTNSSSFSYNDFSTNEVHSSETLKRISNNNSTSFQGSVVIDGLSRPITITISETAVFVTLPMSDGSYYGEGNLKTLRLKKSQPITDDVKEVKLAPLEPVRLPEEGIPKCLNC